MTYADRAREVLKWRLSGITYSRIGLHFGFNPQRAYQVCQWQIDKLLDPLFPPETPEDQYLADAIINSPYLSVRGRVVFLDNQEES